MFFNDIVFCGLLAVLLEAPLGLAIQLNPRTLPNTIQVRQTCISAGETTCEESCMPLGAVCCNDGSSTYCEAGQDCVPDGCCPHGETCIGGGGTTTNDIPFPPSTSLGDPITFGDFTTALNSLPTDNPFTDIPTGFDTSGLSPLPTDNPFASIPTGFATSDLGSLPTDNPLAGMPTLPSSIDAVLMTAAPSDALQNPCQLTATPAWVQSLPSDVRSGLASYENAVQSWFSANSAQLGTMTRIAGICTEGAGTQATAGAHATGGPSQGAAPRLTGAVGASFAGAIGVLGVMVVL